MAEEIANRRALMHAYPHPTIEQWREATPQPTLDMIASFQATVIEELLRRAITSADQIGAESIIVSGGVSCNAGLRQQAKRYAGYRFLFPSPGLSTDNAAMIAAAAFPKFEKGEFASFDLRAQANLKLA